MAPKSWFLIFLVEVFFARDTLSLPNIVPRISGGNVRQSQELPFMVSLRVKNRFDQLVHICGGSILSSKIVISAAHCTDNPRRGPSAYRVYVGAGEEFEINILTPHPYYNSMFLKNDLVIIELAKPITFSNTVQPIQLHRSVLENGIRVMTAGWGTKKNDSEPLKMIELETISNKQCRSQMIELVSKPPPIYDTIVCAINIKNGDGIDNGDSGGPIIFNNSLVGVTTWASGFAAGSPNGFQRISFFVDWVDEMVRDET